MKNVPWKYVHTWNCNFCGECCRPYIVALTTNEWTRIFQNYGLDVVQPSLEGFYLRKNTDGRCIFQYRLGEAWLCAIQHMKPLACKLWPFRVLQAPKYGEEERAFYAYRGQRFFIYVDSLCQGLTWGRPDDSLMLRTLPEVVELKLGVREEQHYSTISLSRPSSPRMDFLRLVSG